MFIQLVGCHWASTAMILLSRRGCCSTVLCSRPCQKRKNFPSHVNGRHNLVSATRHPLYIMPRATTWQCYYVPVFKLLSWILLSGAGATFQKSQAAALEPSQEQAAPQPQFGLLPCLQAQPRGYYWLKWQVGFRWLGSYCIACQLLAVL